MSLQKSRQNSEVDSANQTSQSLIARLKEANDPDAWARLVKLYSPLVYFWVRQSGVSHHDLQDVFQEVFHALSKNIRKFKPIKNGSFRGWLRTLTRNKVTDHFRKLGREPFPVGGTEAKNYFEQIPESPALSDSQSEKEYVSQTEAEIHQIVLKNALSNIESSFQLQTWRAFWMVVIDGRETSDVADELNMRPGTVRVAKSRVLKRLRQELGDSID